MTSSVNEETRPQQGWAHRQGKIAMHPIRPMRWDAEALSARAQIAEAFYRFGMAFDEIQLDALCSCFVEDGVLESSLARAEPRSSVRGHEEIRRHLRAAMDVQQDQRRHLMSNVVVEDLVLERGTAKALAQCIVAATGTELQLACAVIYTAELRRDPDDCWRFSYFFIGMDKYVPSAR